MRVILVGGSKTVQYLARQFARRHYHVTIINRDAAACHELRQLVDDSVTVVHGDGTTVQRLEEAGARMADIVLALTPNDPHNLIACQIASRKFGVPRTIAMVNDPDNEEVFRKLGVSVAFSATRVLGSIIDQETDFEEVHELMPIAHGKLHVSDLTLNDESPSVGKTLRDLNLTDGTLVAAVIRNDVVIVPNGATRLQTGDNLIVITHPQDETRDLTVICG
ncbi:MAG: NAD-binding protein [Chloroflexota bacterium]|nr:NAD-binding protein [Chloroflexota bacterium]